jgi:biofilm protein TabA
MIILPLNQSKDIRHLSPSLLSAIRHLQQSDLSSLENGKHTLGAGMTLAIDEYTTKLVSEKKAEQHRMFIDVQYVIDGEEAIGAGFLGEEVIEEYIEAKDRALYGKIRDEILIPMRPGTVAIFFPSDVHRPGCQLNGPCNVKKAVIKVPVIALN